MMRKFFSSFLILILILTFVAQIFAQRPPVKSKSGTAIDRMHPSVEAQSTFTKMDEIIGFTVEGINVTMNYEDVSKILHTRGWLQLDVNEQNHGLFFYKGERRTVNVPPNSLHPKPGTTMYKLLFRTTGQATTMYFGRQKAIEKVPRGTEKSGSIPHDALELTYVKNLKKLVCSGYTDERMIKRYCSKTDTNELAGFGTSKTVPVFNSLEESLSVRAISQQQGGEISITYYRK